jgi:hypothetical protein
MCLCMPVCICTHLCMCAHTCVCMCVCVRACVRTPVSAQSCGCLAAPQTLQWYAWHWSRLCWSRLEDVLLLRGQGRCEHCAWAGHYVSHELHSSRIAGQTSARHEHLTSLLKLYSTLKLAFVESELQTSCLHGQPWLCSRNTPRPLTQKTQPGKYADGSCTSWKWPQGGPADESWAASWSFQT